MDYVRGRTSRLLIRYRVGHDTAASVLTLCGALDFTMIGFSMGEPGPTTEIASVELRVRGKTAVEILAHDLQELPAIVSVAINPPED